MEVTIRITAQYYENYSDTDTPYWKPKGGHEFTIKADADTIFYAYDSDLKEILSNMVADESDFHNKYEYLDHEVKFFEATELSSDKFEKLLMIKS
jgi:hypothetical protein